MPRDRQRATLEAGERLDIRQLRLRPNIRGSTSWSWTTGLEMQITAVTGPEGGTLILRYNSREQRIDLEAQHRHFGGTEWAALCPRTGRRAKVIWRPPGAATFASRHAWRRQVGYQSQFLDPVGRAWATKRRVARRLGSRDPDDHDLPPKPRWMRWKTYDRFVDRYIAAEEQIEYHCGLALARLLRRHGPGLLD